MIKRTLIYAVALSLILSGCGPTLKSKTIVIPDTEADNRNPAAANEEVEVNKIYRMMENGDFLGWVTKDMLLGTLWKTNRSRSLERIDYKNNSYETWSQLEGSTEIGAMSPNGQFVFSFVQNNGKETLTLLQLTSPQLTVIGDMPPEHARSSPLSWSNNSRYVSFSYSSGKSEPRGTGFTVYDTSSHSSKEYKLPPWNVSSVKVSNDGTSAMIVRFMERRYSIVYGKLEGNAFTSQYEHDMSGDSGTFDFLNDDQILFVGHNGSLIVFDRRNSNTTIVTEPIGSFRLSNDRKMIAYSKERDTLFIAKVQGNSLMDEKAVYKGIIPLQLEWSPDNKKILLGGTKSYGPRPAVSAPEAPSDPLILELK